jgi:hypothetical protein
LIFKVGKKDVRVEPEFVGLFEKAEEEVRERKLWTGKREVFERIFKKAGYKFKEVLNELYKRGLSLGNIASLCRVDTMSVHRWFKYYGIKTRNRIEAVKLKKPKARI